MLLCEPLDGEQAERIGLVSLCVDDDAVLASALEICERLVASAPSAVRWTKGALNNWLRMFGPAFDASLALEFMGMAGEEVKEGLQAIRDKRKPQFEQDIPV